MNFFTDNGDIQFLLGHINLALLADLAERGFRFRSDFDFAPISAPTTRQSPNLTSE